MKPRVPTGIEGLDDILAGGFPANRLYLLQGNPGVGKTTMALRFLIEGARNHEPVLYVTLSETHDELRSVAASHGWLLEGLTIYQMSVGDQALTADEDNTLFVPAEVELGERMQALLVEVDRVKPSRVVIDSCSELRLLAQSPLRFRRQVLALKAELLRRGCTVMLIENPVGHGGDVLLQSLVHGVVELEQYAPIYGAERRRLRIVKMREVKFRGGFHDMVIRTGGVMVFPRLIANEHHLEFPADQVSSGLPELDALLGGGLQRGTSTLFMGPSGSGKSALTSSYADAAARRGEKTVMFTFDEGQGSLLQRARSLGIRIDDHVASGMITVQQIDPAELSMGELIGRIRQAVEVDAVKVVVIDSVNGYLLSMPDQSAMLPQLHELLAYLRQRGVLALLVITQHGVVGEGMEVPADVSYVADTVILLRYFEAQGRVRKAVSVLKKRSGPHENTVRELTLSGRGIRVGEPLTDFSGVLTGVPVYVGALGKGSPLAKTDVE
jgi:circadian clock protein KaiC